MIENYCSPCMAAWEFGAEVVSESAGTVVHLLSGARATAGGVQHTTETLENITRCAATVTGMVADLFDSLANDVFTEDNAPFLIGGALVALTVSVAYQVRRREQSHQLVAMAAQTKLLKAQAEVLRLEQQAQINALVEQMQNLTLNSKLQEKQENLEERLEEPVSQLKAEGKQTALSGKGKKRPRTATPRYRPWKGAENLGKGRKPRRAA